MHLYETPKGTYADAEYVAAELGISVATVRKLAKPVVLHPYDRRVKLYDLDAVRDVHAKAHIRPGLENLMSAVLGEKD